ncbi:hypothetical protein [Simplicispira psychrophila]|uniref:hypothetical protein n=1 Tax=Simplicispira psychrophila TaxID=80882 RepID=UPI0004852D9C|nr:hypothetical protein [Simplicispira psychrophila]
MKSEWAAGAAGAAGAPVITSEKGKRTKTRQAKALLLLLACTRWPRLSAAVRPRTRGGQWMAGNNPAATGAHDQKTSAVFRQVAYRLPTDDQKQKTPLPD